jgi:hypothetical protein
VTEGFGSARDEVGNLPRLLQHGDVAGRKLNRLRADGLRLSSLETGGDHLIVP